jgi:hypothetical protein
LALARLQEKNEQERAKIAASNATAELEDTRRWIRIAGVSALAQIVARLARIERQLEIKE